LYNIYDGFLTNIIDYTSNFEKYIKLDILVLLHMFVNLPLFVKVCIAELDIKTYSAIVRVDKDAARYYSSCIQQKLVKKRFTVIIIDEQKVMYKLNGKFFRQDGPAIEWVNGTKKWYIDGKKHRTDGPAVEWYNGYKEWWVHGLLHREDGPAIEYSNGHREWRVNGKLHREDGPAKEFDDGTQIWYRNDKIHRKDGPALIKTNGIKEWWKNGIRILVTSGF
jgi:hypothetical protein